MKRNANARLPQRGLPQIIIHQKYSYLLCRGPQREEMDVYKEVFSSESQKVTGTKDENEVVSKCTETPLKQGQDGIKAKDERLSI